MSGVREVASAEFYQLSRRAEGKLLVTQFTATWCGPCRRVAPQYEALAKRTPDVEFVKVRTSLLHKMSRAVTMSQHMKCGCSCSGSGTALYEHLGRKRRQKELCPLRKGTGAAHAAAAVVDLERSLCASRCPLLRRRCTSTTAATPSWPRA